MLFPEPLKPPFSAKLGIIARESDGMVSIDTFSPDSAAAKAGLEKGDVITSVDSRKIHTVDDIKIALFGKEQGQTASVKVVRKRFLFGTRELEFLVPL